MPGNIGEAETSSVAHCHYVNPDIVRAEGLCSPAARHQVAQLCIPDCDLSI